MARSQTYLARCDRKECRTVLEVEQSTIAPAGWLRINVEIDGKWDQTSALEFCSEKCLAIWARDRGKVTNGNGHTPSSDIRKQILEAISVADGEFKSLEIQELTGITQSTVDRHLREMVTEGIITVTNEGNGRSNNPRLFVKGGDA